MPWWQTCLCAQRCTDPPPTNLLQALNLQSFARYLANYGETEARALLAGSSLTANVHGRALESDDRWQGCLVVPAFDESLEALQQLPNSPLRWSLMAWSFMMDIYMQLTR